MLRALRTLRSPPTNPKPPLPTTTFSTRRKNPPPPPLSEISAALSSLPPRFSSSHLSSAIHNLENPHLCLPLLLSSLHRPSLLLHHPSSAHSPFLAAVLRLGNSHLYPQMDSVASLAFSLPSLPLPEPFFNSLILFYSNARWISKAIGVYKIMRSPKSKIRPTNRTFRLLFNAILAHRGANSYVHYLYMDALRSLFRQMAGSGVEPDVHALNAMIKGYVLSLHLNDALRIFHQMVPVYGVAPNEHTYSYLVHGLCSQGRTRNAMELYGEMKGKGLVVTARGCNSLVSGLAMAGEVGEAVGVMWEGVGVGRRPDFITCRAVVEEICRRGRVGDAVGLLREMRRKEVIDGRCYKELVVGLGEEYRDY